MIDKQLCEEKIRWVAAALHEPDEFKQRRPSRGKCQGLAVIVEELKQVSEFREVVEGLQR